MPFKRALSLFTLLFLSVVAQAGEENEAAIKEFGVKTYDPINSGYLFLEYEYVHPPYVIERRGFKYFINNKEAFSFGANWPPEDLSERFTNPKDPGDIPPSDSAPLDKPAEGERYNYWQKKWFYLRVNNEAEVARDKFLDLMLKNCPKLVDVRWVAGDGEGSIKWNIRDSKLTYGFMLSIVTRKPDIPAIRERIERNLNQFVKKLEGPLSSKCALSISRSGGFITIPPQRALEFVRILSDSTDVDASYQSLISKGFLIRSTGDEQKKYLSSKANKDILKLDGASREVVHDIDKNVSPPPIDNFLSRYRNVLIESTVATTIGIICLIIAISRKRLKNT